MAFANAYVREGAKVVIADIDHAGAVAAAADIGPAAHAVEMDVSDQASIEAGVFAAIQAFGQIDILINNAAIFTAAPITDITREDYARVFDINVSGTLFTSQAIARHMMELGIKGRILNLLRLKSKGSVFLSACGARLNSFPTEVGGFKPIGGK